MAHPYGSEACMCVCTIYSRYHARYIVRKWYFGVWHLVELWRCSLYTPPNDACIHVFYICVNCQTTEWQTNANVLESNCRRRCCYFVFFFFRFGLVGFGVSTALLSFQITFDRKKNTLAHTWTHRSKKNITNGKWPESRMNNAFSLLTWLNLMTKIKSI